MDGESFFPEAFARRIEEQLGTRQARLLLDALDGDPVVSVRYNPYKTTSKPALEPVPWSRYGFYLTERPSFTLDPSLHGGAYYVQEASSMFLEAVFGAIADSEAPLRILDLCAAPGGKTTLLSSLAGPESLIVANEPVRARAAVLSDNVRRWGIGNVVVTSADPARFAPFGHYFDLILVDAPCSGEGMFRKDRESRRQWSESGAELCAARQRRILGEAWDALRPGGALIYSTCTFNPAENEQNVRWLASQYDCEGTIDVGTAPEWGIERGETDGIGTFRFYPHRTRGEGFFAAVARKADGRRRLRVPKPRKSVFSELPKSSVREVARWVGQPELMRFATVDDTVYGYYGRAFAAVREIAENLPVVRSGIRMGQLFGGRLKPDHALAMFHDLNPEAAPTAVLDREQALDYLRKRETDPALLSEGINRIACDGLTLGWIKRIGNRSNNLYPKELRIATLCSRTTVGMYSILHSAAYREAASGSEAGRLRSPSLSGRPRRTISPTSIVFSKVLFSEEFPIHGLAGPLFPAFLKIRRPGNPPRRIPTAPQRARRNRRNEAGNRSSQYENGFFFRHNGKSKPKNVKRVRNERNHRSKNAR